MGFSGLFGIVVLIQGNKENLRSIQAYIFYLERNEIVDLGTLNLLLPRLVDQLTILSQLESEVKHKNINDDRVIGWEGLPKGKVSLRDDSVQLICAMQKLHVSFLKQFVKLKNINSQGLLFWFTMG